MKHKVIVIKDPIPDSVYAEALLDDDGMPFDVVDPPEINDLDSDYVIPERPF